MRKAKVYFNLPEVFDINHTYVDGVLTIMDKYGNPLMELTIEKEKVYPAEENKPTVIEEQPVEEPIEDISEE